MKKSLFVWIAAIGFVVTGTSSARAAAIYTISNGGGGTFNIIGVGVADNDPALAGSGATTLDSDDLLIKFVNNSSSTIFDIHVTGNGSDPFGFDSSGPWAGSYEPPDGSVTLSPNAPCGFCDNGNVLFTGGLAPGRSAFVGFENDGNGVVANAALSVVRSTAAVPEPATLTLLGIGAAAGVLRRRRRIR